jgi:hypothetical protein
MRLRELIPILCQARLPSSRAALIARQGRVIIGVEEHRWRPPRDRMQRGGAQVRVAAEVTPGGSRAPPHRTGLHTEIPFANREINREFCGFRASCADFAPSQRVNSVACSKIPYATEQGIFLKVSGKIFGVTGNSRAKTANPTPDQYFDHTACLARSGGGHRCTIGDCLHAEVDRVEDE